jgi:GGDEF domain-containing protein
MQALAIAFWGAFFGTVALMLAASLAAYARSLHRVALTAAMSALLSALFVVAFLGWFPLRDPSTEARVLAHVAALTSTALGLMLLAMLGLMRHPESARRLRLRLLGLGVAVVAAGWLLEPVGSLALSALLAIGIAAAALVVCVRSARRGDRLAWMAVSGVSFMLVALCGLSWTALNDGQVSWVVHAVSAVGGMAYLATMASALWVRYSHLIELREVRAQGPSYDPVTRMRSHAETGHLLGATFVRHEGDPRPVGVIVVSLGNLYALENLHGRAAVNHALFVCASRLRRCVPVQVEMGRLSEDGFLLLMRDGADAQGLVRLARVVAERLGRPVVLATGEAQDGLDGDPLQWVAHLGVGLLQALPHVRPAQAVGLARAMSRTAWSYTSRIAWFDHADDQIAELPADETV